MNKNIIAASLSLAAILWPVCSTSAQTFPGLGVYVGNPNGNDPNAEAQFVSNLDAFAMSMGQSPTTMDVFVDYTQPISSWVSNASWAAWSQWGSPARSLTPVVSVGLADEPTADPGGSWNEPAAVGMMNDIASGNYDSVYTGIVNAYKAQGYTKIYLRIGWEMNGGWEPWYATADATDAAAYVAAWKHVANLAHGVAGITVETVWSPCFIHWTAVGVESTYPADSDGVSYVDVIAPDAYSPVSPDDLYDWTTHVQDSATVWAASTVNREHYWDYPASTEWVPQGGWGMISAIALAKSQNKQFGLSETGAGGNGTSTGPIDESDFPIYLANRLTSAMAQGVSIAFVNVWDVNVSDGNWNFSTGSKPNEANSWLNFVNTMALATSPELPNGEIDVDIGSPSPAGSAVYNSGAYTLKGGGANIWGTSDQFNYLSQSLSGDQTLIARVTGLTDTNVTAKIGVMFRDSSSANAKFAMLDVKPAGGLEFITRNSTGGSAVYNSGVTTDVTPSISTPIWIKLVKSGASYTAYYATTTTTPSIWITIGAVTVSLDNSTYEGGLSTVSLSNGTLTTAMVDNYSVVAATVPGAVTGVTQGTTTGATMTISWTPVSDATSYNVGYQSASGGSWTSISTSATSINLTGLAPNTWYWIEIQAANASGDGSWTGTYSFKTTNTVSVPDAVTSVAQGTTTTSSMVLSWPAASGATGYNIGFQSASGGSWSSTSTSGTSYTLTGLTTGTWYWIEVQGTNSVGAGPWTGTYSFKTH